MVKKISEKEFKDEIKEGVVLVDFSATWCGPCKMLAPILEEASAQFDGKATFLNVDVDDNQRLAHEYGITNIPALVLIKDGETKEVQVGFQPKESIATFVEKFL